MANNYTMFSFEIPLTAAELPWVKETLGKPPRELWPEGYEAEDEPEVEFDWCIEDQDTPTPCLFIYSEEGGNPDAAETFCKLFLANAPTDLKMIGFEMAYTCSKPRPGEFGGAACLVYVAPNGDIESKWNSTCSWLDEEMGKVKTGSHSALLDTDDGDECPLCQCGTVEHGDGEVVCCGECGSVAEKKA